MCWPKGQKVHVRKCLLMVYVANKNRDSAIATLRLEQGEIPSLRAANRYLAGVTKWTGTANAKNDGWTGDETFAPRFAEPLPLMGVLLENSAKWRPVDACQRISHSWNSDCGGEICDVALRLGSQVRGVQPRKGGLGTPLKMTW